MQPRMTGTATSSMLCLSTLLRSLPQLKPTPPALNQYSVRHFSSTAPQLSIRKKKKAKKHVDPYRAAQARQRRVANEARQRTLTEQRQIALGDPVRSSDTPFIRSLRTSLNATATSDTSEASSQQQYLNFFLKPSDLSKQLTQSKWLTEPIPVHMTDNAVSSVPDRARDEVRRERFTKEHQNAEVALQRITEISQGSSKDRTRMHVQRCIEEFGRHNTDQVLPPKPASLGQASNPGDMRQPTGIMLSEAEAAAAVELASLPKRAGRDTGSSEVQIAILTAKINTLADNLHKKDKHNKRNLRLLVHRRQKLLAYLRNKERGGPRWQNLVEKLGINEAMWKGEISL